jgi:hypothetical protein
MDLCFLCRQMSDSGKSCSFCPGIAVSLYSPADHFREIRKRMQGFRQSFPEKEIPARS